MRRSRRLVGLGTASRLRSADARRNRHLAITCATRRLDVIGGVGRHVSRLAYPFTRPLTALSPGPSVTYHHFPRWRRLFCATLRVELAAQIRRARLGSFGILVWRLRGEDRGTCSPARPGRRGFVWYFSVANEVARSP